MQYFIRIDINHNIDIVNIFSARRHDNQTSKIPQTSFSAGTLAFIFTRQFRNAIKNSTKFRLPKKRNLELYVAELAIRETERDPASSNGRGIDPRGQSAPACVS